MHYKKKTIMAKLKGILFDYGHTLVYFPQIEKTHLVAARNVQVVLQDLGVSVNASRIQTLVGSFAHRTDNVVMNMEEEFMEILYILGVANYSPKMTCKKSYRPTGGHTSRTFVFGEV